MSLFQASQQMATISSYDLNIRFDSPLSVMNCQMFSTGFNSGALVRCYSGAKQAPPRRRVQDRWRQGYKRTLYVGLWARRVGFPVMPTYRVAKVVMMTLSLIGLLIIWSRQNQGQRIPSRFPGAIAMHLLINAISESTDYSTKHQYLIITDSELGQHDPSIKVYPESLAC